ncbi:nucleotidyltransferase domain-containing protein [Paenibacillus provencensis]|uniref:Nucleotidyltransferase domain-containing protein n=1 Tax=Paenibacillus provencensis TaxID=441151 RepID=A0ABW3PY38_9BACL|nr:nucleotidyltransferase domain-containing protein [Paenibacillus sp. MER 78]MCM3127468.1 nucleotidyltransferase domain-containing protein [Paenibacillus sp. MER 78]
MVQSDLHSYLFAMAQEKSESIKNHVPDVKAIAITGSVASGIVYPSSDIDIIAYVEGSISDQLVKYVEQDLQITQGKIIAETEEVLAVNYWLHQIKCEVVYFSERFACRKLNSVLEDYDISLNTHTVVTGILKARTLYDPAGLIKGWKDRLSQYPERLAIALIESNLNFFPEPVLRASFTERNDHLYVIEGKLRNQEKLLSILCGLNRMYHPGKWKSVLQVYEQMCIKPSDLEHRMIQVWEQPMEDSIEMLTELIYETLDLISIHRPNIDITSARNEYQRFW